MSITIVINSTNKCDLNKVAVYPVPGVLVGIDGVIIKLQHSKRFIYTFWGCTVRFLNYCRISREFRTRELRRFYSMYRRIDLLMAAILEAILVTIVAAI